MNGPEMNGPAAQVNVATPKSDMPGVSSLSGPQLVVLTDHGTLTGFLNRDLLELIVTGTQFCLRAASGKPAAPKHATLTALFGRVLAGGDERVVIQGPAELLGFLTQQERLHSGFVLRPARSNLLAFDPAQPGRARRRA